MNIQTALLTDSGGFQAFSLSQNRPSTIMAPNYIFTGDSLK